MVSIFFSLKSHSKRMTLTYGSDVPPLFRDSKNIKFHNKSHEIREIIISLLGGS